MAAAGDHVDPSPADDLVDWARDELVQEVLTLRQAVLSRDIIGQAKGMIRLIAGCDDTRSFEILSRLSQDTNRRLREVATEIVQSGATGAAVPADVAVRLSELLVVR